MINCRSTRRQFLKSSVTAALGSGAVACYWPGGRAWGRDSSDRLNVAAIGVGGRGKEIGMYAARLGNMVACCDVDRQRLESFAGQLDDSASLYGDYRRILDCKDVHAVTIGTPDHWHAKIAIEAMQSGKDVYCEKPLTLTIDEGKQICRVARESGRVVQVGTQQRSEYSQYFLKAVAIARSGRLGKRLKATVSVDEGEVGGPFQEAEPPAHLDWEMWLGQAPWTPYIKERTHETFRWWLEYSGGQVTDWGVHHMDIAMWSLGVDETGPVSVHGRGKFHSQKNCYNTAQTFDCTLTFANGNEIRLKTGKNELLIAGAKGRIRVNRGGLTGKPVEEIAASAAEGERLERAVRVLYRGKPLTGHMQNFFDCIADRSLPVSDVFTHHRSVTACHLANIAMLLDRKLTWDPEKEDFVNDPKASAMLSREQRAGYQIVV